MFSQSIRDLLYQTNYTEDEIVNYLKQKNLFTDDPEDKKDDDEPINVEETAPEIENNEEPVEIDDEIKDQQEDEEEAKQEQKDIEEEKKQKLKTSINNIPDAYVERTITDTDGDDRDGAEFIRNKQLRDELKRLIIEKGLRRSI